MLGNWKILSVKDIIISKIDRVHKSLIVSLQLMKAESLDNLMRVRHRFTEEEFAHMMSIFFTRIKLFEASLAYDPDETNALMNIPYEDIKREDECDCSSCRHLAYVRVGNARLEFIKVSMLVILIFFLFRILALNRVLMKKMM